MIHIFVSVFLVLSGRGFIVLRHFLVLSLSKKRQNLISSFFMMICIGLISWCMAWIIIIIFRLLFKQLIPKLDAKIVQYDAADNNFGASNHAFYSKAWSHDIKPKITSSGDIMYELIANLFLFLCSKLVWANVAEWVTWMFHHDRAFLMEFCLNGELNMGIWIRNIQMSKLFE